LQTGSKFSSLPLRARTIVGGKFVSLSLNAVKLNWADNTSFAQRRRNVRILLGISK